MHAGFQFHGSSVCNSFRLVCPDTMRLRTSVNQASGSSLFSFAVYAARRTMPNGPDFRRNGRDLDVIGSA
jgi:hypothetical protein